MGFFESLQTAAVSLVVAGNEGVAPFLTLFIVGAIEKGNPDLLAMSSTMESIIASWPGLVFLGIMSVLEFVAKCVPVIDEAVDSVMMFIVPIMSVFGSLSTFGLYNGGGGGDNDDEDGRRLGAASGAIIFLQIVVIILGICLAMSMHMFKMLVRLIGVGWLTGILTIVEIGFCITSVTIAIFVKQIAIFLAAVMIVAAGYNIKHRWWDKRNGGQADETQQIQNEGDLEGDYQATDDSELKKGGNSSFVPTAVATPMEK